MAIGLLAALWLIALDTRLYLRGTSHEHFQVIDWVEQNVPDDTWVAAVQSGTLGYYHDRTINLDGKVKRIRVCSSCLKAGKVQKA